ncbi:MAG: Rha family transcriptional regulator [Alphaproteobacteria bacterium]|nr:Rha family transcriptional regulator [Alphaproteobacteria bacterium]
MNELVILDKKTPVVDSLNMAEGFDIQHRSIYRLITEYEKDLKSFGKVRLEITPSESGQNRKHALLNEEQATFLATLLKNTKKSVQFKKELVKEFYRVKTALNLSIYQQKDPNWLNVRKDGKVIVKQKSRVIDEFIAYAVSNGSNGAKYYHANFAKMENRNMFIFEQKYPNMREVLTIKQMMQVATGDDIIEKAIKEGMEKEMYYKDIFQLAKDRIIKYVEIIGKSPILGLEVK